jgi:hypothetical protein
MTTSRTIVIPDHHKISQFKQSEWAQSQTRRGIFSKNHVLKSTVHIKLYILALGIWLYIRLGKQWRGQALTVPREGAPPRASVCSYCAIWQARGGEKGQNKPPPSGNSHAIQTSTHKHPNLEHFMWCPQKECSSRKTRPCHCAPHLLSYLIPIQLDTDVVCLKFHWC